MLIHEHDLAVKEKKDVEICCKDVKQWTVETDLHHCSLHCWVMAAKVTGLNLSLNLKISLKHIFYNKFHIFIFLRMWSYCWLFQSRNSDMSTKDIPTRCNLFCC